MVFFFLWAVDFLFRPWGLPSSRLERRTSSASAGVCGTLWLGTQSWERFSDEWWFCLFLVARSGRLVLSQVSWCVISVRAFVVYVITIFFFRGRSAGVIEALYILIISSVSMTVCFFFQWHTFCWFYIVVGRLLLRNCNHNRNRIRIRIRNRTRNRNRNRDCIISILVTV